MDDKEIIQTDRVPRTCCPEPGCDHWSCYGCEYLGFCLGDLQKIDYCPRPHKCPNCGADCTNCELWLAPVYNTNYNQMTEAQALISMGAKVEVKDGQKGLQFGHIFIPASDEKPGAIIGISDKRFTVLGTREFTCSECKGVVYLSPSSHALLDRYPDTPIFCLSCFAKRMEEEKSK